jgi:hypothetical protein
LVDVASATVGVNAGGNRMRVGDGSTVNVGDSELSVAWVGPQADSPMMIESNKNAR